jgi:hypothetical protein
VLEILLAASVGELSAVANAHESVGQDVEKEPSDEFASMNAFDAPSPATLVVFVSEEDVFVLLAYEPLVGDGDTVGVTAEILEDLFGSGEGRLDEDDPFLEAMLGEEVVEADGMLEVVNRVGEKDLGATIRLFERMEEIVFEDGGKDFEGDEELGVCVDPTVAFDGGSGPLHDSVGVGVVGAPGAPGV